MKHESFTAPPLFVTFLRRAGQGQPAEADTNEGVGRVGVLGGESHHLDDALGRQLGEESLLRDVFVSNPGYISVPVQNLGAPPLRQSTAGPERWMRT